MELSALGSSLDMWGEEVSEISVGRFGDEDHWRSRGGKNDGAPWPPTLWYVWIGYACSCGARAVRDGPDLVPTAECSLLPDAQGACLWAMRVRCSDNSSGSLVWEGRDDPPSQRILNLTGKSLFLRNLKSNRGVAGAL